MFTLYTVVNFIIIIVQADSVSMMVFLSNWGLILYTLYFITATISSGFFLWRKCHTDDTTLGNTESSQKLPAHVICFWLLTNVTLLTGGVIVILFWGFVYQSNFFSSFEDRYINVNVHAIIYFLVLLDCLMFQMVPIQILHVVYTFTLALVYVIVSVIYTTTTGRLIYTVLDWNNNPGGSVLFLFMAIAFLVVLQFVFYGMYQLKVTFASRSSRERAISTSNLVDT